ncbi:hypothetical protein [Paenibacillus sp. LjRoot56]|uniref:hypothetical protein n=1 Tax=Paenibacillus sp. LjRoot56 TaxID=3342333 RepID=UPI003ED13239
MADNQKLLTWIEDKRYVYSGPYEGNLPLDIARWKGALKILDMLEGDLDLGEFNAVDDEKKRPRWTFEEESKLTSLFKGTDMSYREIGEKIGKTEKSVNNKLRRMGIIKTIKN